MGQPSKFGAIFLFLFGLPFFGFGMVFAFVFLTNSPSVHKTGNPVAGAALGVAFALIGAGLMAGAIYGYRQQKQQAATKAANPDSPWLWREDWATGKALSQKRNSVIGWWIGTLLVSLLTLPFVAGGVPKLIRDSDPTAFLLLGLGLMPTILFVGAVRATIRRERFGKTYFEFGSLPFSPGKVVTGQIHLRLDTSAEHGIDLRLACMRTIVTGSGKEQSKNQIVLWQDQKNVAQGGLTVGPLGTAIPVSFGIPQDGYETNHDSYNDQVAWVLYAKADVPGVDYSDAFEIPVFRARSAAQFETATANFGSNFAASAFAPSSGAAAAGTAPAFDFDASEVAAPANPKVEMSTTADGSTEFYFPAFRNRARTLILLLVTAGWSAMVYFLAHSPAPWFFAPVFGLFDLALVYGSLQGLFGSTKIVVGNGKVISVRKIFGPGKRREITFSEIQSVLATMAVQNSSGSYGSYSISLQTKSGANTTLADSIADRQEARWVVSQIEKLAGLKTDTHVALEGAFGREYGPPPQRGVSTALSPAQQRQSKIAMAIGIALFLAWAGFIFSRAMAFRHGATRSRSSSAASSAAQASPQHRIFPPLTDEALARLQQLPIQDQAEELLERAVQHDERALEVFEQNIMSPDWLGRVKLTDRMKDLERRSEYSKDLRVRYANADLNLSMDGWAKTEQSADLLMERARTDAQYRAAAVYFMGMLAGRGVAYDRLHPVLVDYAKHDPDATVRVWAVEGMRYLGTDEALDELFDSFLNDPSNLVRDRAGCNVSDCGNFKRTQRMHMVEKFIDVAADPNTNANMRNWSFLALHEITDENVPNDATAWRNWYLQHGKEKMLEFERAPWWQIRGDE